MNILHPQLWPDTATVVAGRLQIAGCDVTALAADYGTPLYLLDEATLRTAMRSYKNAFATHYRGPAGIHYASKAMLNLAVAQIIAAEGLCLDVVSGAELLVARRAGLPLERAHLHGNAKTTAELERALAWGVGGLVVDNLDELDRLAALTANQSAPQAVLLRLAPAIAAHTHPHMATGSSDGKFGLALADLDAAVARLQAAPGLRLSGLHAHIGSMIFDTEELLAAVEVLLDQAAYLRDKFDIIIEEISPGGGLGTPYTPDQPVMSIDSYVAALARATVSGCAARNLPLPRLTVEPGRSIVGRAGVALYQVLGRKLLPPPGAAYLHIDGGMGDNIRPALYGARYTAILANRAAEPPARPYHLAGRYCESGDILVHDAPLPAAEPGDIVAVAVSGAYNLSMAATYNLVPRPPLLLLNAGTIRLIQRRESEDDLLARDLPLAE